MPRLSDVQFRALGGKMPDAPGKKPRRRRTKLQADFAEYLKSLGEVSAITAWWEESFKFRLARDTWYTPDFVSVEGMVGSIEWIAYEVKGSWRMPHQEDSRAKLKIAAELYPGFRWYAVTQIKGRWHFERIEPSGVLKGVK